MTTVVNIRGSGCDVYIGRKKTGMHFGNPFGMSKGLNPVLVASREEAVQRYGAWLEGTDSPHLEPERREWVLQNIHTLKDKALGCYCAPLACHGDILAARAEETA